MGLMSKIRSAMSIDGAPRDNRPTAVIATSAREAAVVALEAGNWRGASVAASKLVHEGGEATTPEPWLVYAASAVLNERPVNGVSSIDVGLRNWVEDPIDRSIMLWMRASLAWHQLRDPRTALADFDAARDDCPGWLAGQLASDRKRCASRARARRTLAPEIADAPVYDPVVDKDLAATPLPGLVPGTQPSVWDAVVAVVTVDNELERGPRAFDEDEPLDEPGDWEIDLRQE